MAVANRFVRCMDELTDDELAALWRGALEAVEASGATFGGSRRVSAGAAGAAVQDHFLDMRLNAGSFQNLAHLHLKVWVERNGYHEAMMANPA